MRKAWKAVHWVTLLPAVVVAGDETVGMYGHNQVRTSVRESGSGLLMECCKPLSSAGTKFTLHWVQQLCMLATWHYTCTSTCTCVRTCACICGIMYVYMQHMLDIESTATKHPTCIYIIIYTRVVFGKKYEHVIIESTDSTFKRDILFLRFWNRHSVCFSCHNLCHTNCVCAFTFPGMSLTPMQWLCVFLSCAPSNSNSAFMPRQYNVLQAV